MSRSSKVAPAVWVLLLSGVAAIALAVLFYFQLERDDSARLPAAAEPSVTSVSDKKPVRSRVQAEKPPAEMMPEGDQAERGPVEPVSPAPAEPPAAPETVEPEPVQPALQHMPVDARVKDVVERFKKSELGPGKLAERLMRLGQRGDEVSVRALMALSDEGWMDVSVVQALGSATNSPLKGEIVAHLRGKVTGRKNLEVECSALEGLARVGGDEVLPDLTSFVANNWRRSDGWGPRTCSSIVKGVADLGTYGGGEWLVHQLWRVSEPDWMHDYGSDVVAALKKYPHPLVKEAFLEYARKIRERAAKEDGTPRQYLEEKAKEAEDAAEQMVVPQM